MAIKESLDACLDLLRHLPPSNAVGNLELLVKLRPELEAELRNAIDVPTKILVCDQSSREFLATDYNYNPETHSYRSPWVVDMQLPKRLQQLEALSNKAIDSYRQLYYEGGISSVYFWPTSENEEDCSSFGAAILLKKCVEQESELSTATWDSIHVVEISQEELNTTNTYLIQMTSTVLLDIKAEFTGIDKFNLGGSLTRLHQSTVTASSDPQLIAVIGKTIEETEGRMRSSLQEIYFSKTLEIVNELRPSLPEGYLRNQSEFRDDLKQRVTRE